MRSVEAAATHLLQSEHLRKAAKYTTDPKYQHRKGDRLKVHGADATPDGLGCFNTFCGLRIDSLITAAEARAMQYDQAIAEKVNSLLRLLLNGDERMVEWILRWIASPLQRHGHLNRSMLINRSLRKGVGKGLF